MALYLYVCVERVCMHFSLLTECSGTDPRAALQAHAAEPALWLSTGSQHTMACRADARQTPPTTQRGGKQTTLFYTKRQQGLIVFAS